MRPRKSSPRPASRRPGKSSAETADSPAALQPRPRRNVASRGAGGTDRWLYGRHTIEAALANPQRRWRRLAVMAGQEAEATALIAGAAAEHHGAQEKLLVLERAAFNQLLPEGAVHQGLALEAEPLDTTDLDDVLRAASAGGPAVIIMLDQVTDPHNVGAILRSAAAFGALAVVVPEHGAPPVTATLAKAASGALDRVPLVRVTNLSRALDRMKEAGFWSCGLDEAATAPLAEIDLGQRVVLLLGSEGEGLRRLLREHCDFLARLPTRPELPSLNVSNAAAVALYQLLLHPAGR